MIKLTRLQEPNVSGKQEGRKLFPINGEVQATAKGFVSSFALSELCVVLATKSPQYCVYRDPL
jgi:hypothetical protein